MKKIINNLKGDEFVFSMFVISFVFIILAIVFIAINIKNLPYFMPVFNQMPWGYQRLGTKQEFFIPTAATFLIFLLNTKIGYSLKKNNLLLFRFSFLTTAIVSFLNILFTLEIIFLIK